MVSFSAEEGPPLQTDLSYYSYEYDPDPYASEADVFEIVAELTTASTLKEMDKIQEVVTTVEWWARERGIIDLVWESTYNVLTHVLGQRYSVPQKGHSYNWLANLFSKESPGTRSC